MSGDGHWEERRLEWHETRTEHCAVCGALVPRRAWVFDDDGSTWSVCGPSCQELYETYFKQALAERGGHG